MNTTDTVVSSRDIAEDFGKDHAKVIRSPENIIDKIGNRKTAQKLFIESTYQSHGKNHKEYLMGHDGFFLVTMGFTGDFALHKKLEYLSTFNSGGLVETINRQSETIKELQILLTQSGIIKPFVNPRYTFENLVTRWKQATNSERVRMFYDQIGEWYGVTVPYSDTLTVPVRDWILTNIPMEVIQELVVGLETKTIVQSAHGKLVSLNGVFGNTVEWERVKQEFGHKCAYCGKEAALIAEHITAQTVVAQKHPERTDLIGNIIPACGDCNKSKRKQNMKTWYHEQPFFDDERYWKIIEHQRRYELCRI